MTIRRVVPLYLGITSVSMIALSYAAFHVIVMKSCSDLERDEALRTLAHAAEMVRTRVDALATNVRDWATWNDMYDFVGGLNPGFMERNVLPETFRALGINYLAVVDTAGRVVASRWSRGQGFEPTPPCLDSLASRTREATRGVVLTDEGWFMGAAAPILTGEGRGPARGVLLMARQVDQAFVAHLGHKVAATVGLGTWEIGPGGFGPTVQTLQGNVRAQCPLGEAWGQVPRLEVILPRNLRLRAEAALLSAMAVLGVGAVAAMLGGVVVAERVLLGRLARLAQAVRGIHEGGSGPVPCEGRDELADLARAINATLDSLGRAQARLQANEERLRRIAESIPDGLMTVEDGKVVFVNDRLCQISGFEKSELMTLPWRTLLAEEDQQRAERFTHTSPPGELPGEVEVWLRRKDGGRRLVRVRHAHSGSGLSPQHLLVVLTDVTERALAEQELQRLRAFTELILQTMAEGVMADDEDGICRYCNPAAASLLGYSPEELLGRHWASMVPRDQWGVVERANEVRRQGISHRYELEMLRRDGTRVPVEISGAPLSRGGVFVGTVAVFTDITSRRALEAERERLLATLRDQAEQMRSIMDTVPEGVVVTDASLRVAVANAAGREYLQTLASLEGETLLALGGVPLSQVVGARGNAWTEVRVRGKVFAITGRPWDNRGWVVVIRDATEERAVQARVREAERMEAVGQVAAGIGHDFNNILATIVGHAQLVLRERGLPPPVEERVKAILEHGQRGGVLVGQLLDYASQTLAEAAPVDLVKVIADVAEATRAVKPEGIDLQVEVPVAHCWTTGSYTSLKKVLMNLVQNALEAMAGSGTLRLALEMRPQGERADAGGGGESEWAAIVVDDTGPGIPEHIMSRLFEPFVTTKRPEQGRGLGLAQAHGLVRQHGGKLEVATRRGRGTTFTVLLPLGAPRGEEMPCREPLGPQGQDVVMVVDDEDAVREVMAAMLSELGCTVLAAAGGEEALRLLEAHRGRVSVVFSDLVMPGMDGITLVERMAALQPGIRAVVVSGYPPDHDSGVRLSALSGTWLQKPVTMEVLQELLSKRAQGDSATSSSRA